MEGNVLEPHNITFVTSYLTHFHKRNIKKGRLKTRVFLQFLHSLSFFSLANINVSHLYLLFLLKLYRMMASFHSLVFRHGVAKVVCGNWSEAWFVSFFFLCRIKLTERVSCNTHQINGRRAGTEVVITENGPALKLWELRTTRKSWVFLCVWVWTQADLFFSRRSLSPCNDEMSWFWLGC